MSNTPLEQNGIDLDSVLEKVNALPQAGITPTGNINITDTNVADVTNYATAQVVDADLIASNIKEGVNILGILGTFAGGGGGGIDVASATRCEVVTIGANTVSNPVQAIEYFGYTSPYPKLIIVNLNSFTTDAEVINIQGNALSSTAPQWCRWRNNAINAPNTFNTSWDCRLVEGSKYLVIDWSGQV